MKKVKAVLIGAGNRGITYTDIMSRMPENYEVVAVAEPIESRREYVRKKHNIPKELCFTDYKDLLKLGKIADIAIVSTMDRQHFEPTMTAIDLKYDILLEKPIAPTKEECLEITKAAKKNNVKIVICTVLRYTPLFITLKDIIDSGKIGKVISINHEECVGNIHQTHSFVRGNWGNSERSSFMLLQKSCHDIDILQWLIGKKCVSVQSYGSLSYFTRENAPEGSAEYCIEGCKYADTCPYNAVKLYLDDKENGWFRTTCTKLQGPTDEDVKKAISETQYGKCVFKCDNDVVDHQVVNMLFEDDITVSFTMNPFGKDGRYIHIMGTGGEIHAALAGDTPIKCYNYLTDEETVIPLVGKDGIAGGHGGGDEGIVKTLYSYLNGEYNGDCIPDIEESCYNHMIVFAAEESRLMGKTVDIDEFLKKK